MSDCYALPMMSAMLDEDFFIPFSAKRGWGIPEALAGVTKPEKRNKYISK